MSFLLVVAVVVKLSMVAAVVEVLLGVGLFHKALALLEQVVIRVAVDIPAMDTSSQVVAVEHQF
jgi:hypothetical protein